MLGKLLPLFGSRLPGSHDANLFLVALWQIAAELPGPIDRLIATIGVKQQRPVVIYGGGDGGVVITDLPGFDQSPA